MPIFWYCPIMESNTSTQYRVGQYDTFRNPEKKRYLVKQIVKAKIESQIRFLQIGFGICFPSRLLSPAAKIIAFNFLFQLKSANHFEI